MWWRRLERAPANTALALAPLLACVLALGELCPCLGAPRPARSPDEDWVAYQTARHGPWQLYLSSEDGEVRWRIANVKANTEDPQWSLVCGSGRLAYQSDEHGQWDIYVVRPDGSDSRVVVSSEFDEQVLNWSCDSQEIIFQGADAEDHQDVYGIWAADGSNLRRLTDHLEFDGVPVIWPLENDGRREFASYVLPMMPRIALPLVMASRP